MAKAPPKLSRQPRRRLLPALLFLAIVLLAALAWFWRPLNAYADTGASFGARIGCSCRFVAGRSLADCRKDFEPGMALVTLGEDVTARTVTARFPLLASHTATHRPGYGCVLEPWRD